MTWRRGREIVTRHRLEEEGPLIDFVAGLATSPEPPVRVPGTAIFLNAPLPENRIVALGSSIRL